MGKYIKLFETHSAYSAYINGQNPILPNVSYCEDNNEVHYNPYIETKLVVKFNVTDTSSATQIGSYLSYGVTEIEIDGTILPSVVDTYTFNTTGEHIVKYTLENPTKISGTNFNRCANITNIIIPSSVTTIEYEAFRDCTGLTNLTIPNTVTAIGNLTFGECSGLTSVTIGNGITSIGNSAFKYCSSLASVTIKATTPPTLGSQTFDSNASGRKIYVPSASVDTYKAASGWSTYASDIEAIPST